jgi:hypothetical protein
MSSNQSITTTFPLGLFCTATLSSSIAEISPRLAHPAPREMPIIPEALSDEEIDELTADLCSAGKSA